MLNNLIKFASFCWKPLNGNSSNAIAAAVDHVDGAVRRDGLLWFCDIGKHAYGEFSMAVIQGNPVLEDQSQIESGPFGTFVGIYDGHGGPQTARYVCDNLFEKFREISEEDQDVTSATIQRAFLETEEGFTSLVSDLWSTQPQIASVGTCCLVGVVSQQTLYVANVGDSRVVLGREVDDGVAAIQLSTEHNAKMEAVRDELKELHPDDPQIVVFKNGAWRVKGIIQVSRSIGDLYMKQAQFNSEHLDPKFRLPEPMKKPILTANPSMISLPLQSNDSFLIFASDGLWEYLSNEKAVDIVHKNPRAGSAKRLINAALSKAARKWDVEYSELTMVEKKLRRHIHDDITVIVLFLNHDLITGGFVDGSSVSLRSDLDH